MPHRAARRRVDGMLLLDKPVGASSNWALQKARKLFNAEKAGHAGTLDPLASGLLLLFFGEATKFAGLQLDADKEYLATLKLGERTSTGDSEGGTLETRGVDHVTEPMVKDALARFRGELQQVPPMHSALKREGVPLYKLARRGEEVARTPRSIVISAIELLGFEPPQVQIRVRCSKGTYVRVLAEDIGKALGTVAHLSALRRTASGRFSVANAITLDALEALAESARASCLASLSEVLGDMPVARLGGAEEVRFLNGQPVPAEASAAGQCAVYGASGAVLGLGIAEAGLLRPMRLLASTQAAEKHQKTL